MPVGSAGPEGSARGFRALESRDSCRPLITNLALFAGFNPRYGARVVNQVTPNYRYFFLVVQGPDISHFRVYNASLQEKLVMVV